MHIKLCSRKNGIWRKEDLRRYSCAFLSKCLINRERSVRKRSTDSGILSVPSWALPLLQALCLCMTYREVFETSTCSLAAKSSIWELHQALLYLTCPISWVPYSFPFTFSL